MATATLTSTLRNVFESARNSADRADGELLTRYRTLRDQDAFSSLVRRHGPMVLGVCRRVLRDSHAADDAFQATFIVLAKKADTVRPPDRLAPWLHGVAYRTAIKARGRAFRRQHVETMYATHSERPQRTEDFELLLVIDAHVNALPEKYRTPLVLCGIQGLNKTEAAERLGLPEGTVSSRLARARDMLRDRLTRRGIAVPAAMLTTVFTNSALQASVPAALIRPTLSLSLGTIPLTGSVLTLSNEVIRSMKYLSFQMLGSLAVATSLIGGGFGLLAINADENNKPAPAEAKKVQPAQGDGVKKPQPADPNRKPTDGDKNPKTDSDKIQKDGEKPVKVSKFTGKVGSVDAKTRTITLVSKGESGKEILVTLTADAKIIIDGMEAKLGGITKGVTATFIVVAAKDGQPREANEVIISGPSFGGTVKQVDTATVTIGSEKTDRVFKLTATCKVLIGGKVAKPSDLKVGDRAMVTLNSDESGAVVIVVGGKKGDSEKPKSSPNKPEGEK